MIDGVTISFVLVNIILFYILFKIIFGVYTLIRHWHDENIGKNVQCIDNYALVQKFVYQYLFSVIDECGNAIIKDAPTLGYETLFKGYNLIEQNGKLAMTITHNIKEGQMVSLSTYETVIPTLFVMPHSVGLVHIVDGNGELVLENQPIINKYSCFVAQEKNIDELHISTELPNETMCFTRRYDNKQVAFDSFNPHYYDFADKKEMKRVPHAMIDTSLSFPAISSYWYDKLTHNQAYHLIFVNSMIKIPDETQRIIDEWNKTRPFIQIVRYDYSFDTMNDAKQIIVDTDHWYEQNGQKFTEKEIIDVVNRATLAKNTYSNYTPCMV